MYMRIVFLVVCMFLITGCSQNNSERALPTEKQDNRYVQVKNSSQSEQQSLSNKEIANHLANIASGVPDVNNARAIVAGPYAVVGIDVDKDLDRSRVGTIKYSVSEALYHDPYGKTAVVVADGDVTERIRNMGDKINQGYPVQGIVDELAGIVSRYMPDFPTPENQPQQPDQNKEILPNDEKKKLDEIEDDQSKDNINKQNHK